MYSSTSHAVGCFFFFSCSLSTNVARDKLWLSFPPSNHLSLAWTCRNHSFVVVARERSVRREPRGEGEVGYDMPMVINDMQLGNDINVIWISVTILFLYSCIKLSPDSQHLAHHPPSIPRSTEVAYDMSLEAIFWVINSLKSRLFTTSVYYCFLHHSGLSSGWSFPRSWPLSDRGSEARSNHDLHDLHIFAMKLTWHVGW
jgi:hypothetical protein